MADALSLVTSAADFAARRHSGHTRKGKSGAPYVNHLAEVAALVAATAAGRGAELVAAAYLPDVVEDGHATQAEIEARFGPAVTALVAELTDDMALPEAERKRRQVEEIAHKSRAARLIKLADKLSNVREIADDPPPRWSAKKKREYAGWGVAVVEAGCLGLDAALEEEFRKAAARVLGAGANR